MKKFLKLNERGKLKFDLFVRPLVIYYVIIVAIVIIGSKLGTLSNDTIVGYIHCIIIYFLINYINLLCIDNKELF